VPDRVNQEPAPERPNNLALPAKTKWRSPPFAIRFPETDLRERPLPPRKPPSMLMRLLKSGTVMAAFAILISGGAVLWHYGILQSLRLPAIPSLGGSPQKQREDAIRKRENEAKRQQQKAAAFSQHR
jgi:hypothetical protein